MRLFVALEIPRALSDEIDRRTRSIRADLPRGRWVRAEALHLTLAFLGETDPHVLPDLDWELAAAASDGSAMTLRLRGIGAFPPRGKARVLWTGLTAEDGRTADGLFALQAGVASAVERCLGAALEKRAWQAHITLARLSPPWPRAALERFREAFGEPPGEPFTVRRAVLFESELRPTGARYRAVRTYPLGDPP